MLSFKLFIRNSVDHRVDDRGLSVSFLWVGEPEQRHRAYPVETIVEKSFIDIFKSKKLFKGIFNLGWLLVEVEHLVNDGQAEQVFRILQRPCVQHYCVQNWGSRIKGLDELGEVLIVETLYLKKSLQLRGPYLRSEIFPFIPKSVQFEVVGFVKHEVLQLVNDRSFHFQHVLLDICWVTLFNKLV